MSGIYETLGERDLLLIMRYYGKFNSSVAVVGGVCLEMTPAGNLDMHRWESLSMAFNWRNMGATRWISAQL